MLSYAILSDVFRQISNPQVTCLSNHFAPNSSFGIGCCVIVCRALYNDTQLVTNTTIIIKIDVIRGDGVGWL